MSFPPTRHGTPSCYAYGCRRDDCRAVYRRNYKQGQLRRARGVPGRIDTARIVRHLHRLAESGMDRTDIAEASGVSYRTIGYILAGQRTLQTRNALKLLAVRPLTETPRVDATGTQRRLQALARIGWPIAHLAQQGGHAPGYFFGIARGQYPTVPRATARRVASIYRDHIRKPGPAERTRRHATARGWHGPLAWDAATIDDPAAQPENDADEVFETRDQRAAVRRDDIWLLKTACIPSEEIAARVGLATKTVEAIRAELTTGRKRDRSSRREAA